jgi:hypothetical protein
MKHSPYLLSGVSGALLSAIVFGTTPANSQLAVIDWSNLSINQALQSIQNAMSATLTTISTNLGANGVMALLLTQGFNQNANYVKAQTDAHAQIADASNQVHTQLQSSLYNIKAGDEHTPSPTHCNALDNGQTITTASKQAFSVYAAISGLQDTRGEGGPGMPAYFGRAQAVAASNNQHLARYCNATDATATGCTVSATPNGDQQAESLFGVPTLVDQTALNQANDYIITLTQPIAPATLRGDQLTSEAGREAAAERRRYNAQQSMAKSTLNYVLSVEAPTVQFTDDQKSEMTDLGLSPISNGSMLQAMLLDANRRLSSTNWSAQLQAMPPASVQREIAHELASTNYLLAQLLQIELRHAAVDSAHLAQVVETDFTKTVQMPSPQITN